MGETRYWATVGSAPDNSGRLFRSSCPGAGGGLGVILSIPPNAVRAYRQGLTTMNETFLTLPEVCGRICLRKSWIYDAVARGDFPRPVHLTPRRVAWRESEIEAWKAEKIAARDAG